MLGLVEHVKSFITLGPAVPSLHFPHFSHTGSCPQSLDHTEWLKMFDSNFYAGSS